MLIDSPRLTAQDRLAWSALEGYDAKIAATGHLDRIENTSVETIRRFLAEEDVSS